MKNHDCPNCGGSGPDVVSAGEFRCKFCGTLYSDKQLQNQQRNKERNESYAKNQQLREQAKIEQARATSGMGKRVLLFVGIVLLLIFGFVGYMAKKSMDESNRLQQEMLKNY